VTKAAVKKSFRLGTYPAGETPERRLLWNQSRLNYLESLKKPTDETRVSISITRQRIALLSKPVNE